MVAAFWLIDIKRRMVIVGHKIAFSYKC